MSETEYGVTCAHASSASTGPSLVHPSSDRASAQAFAGAAATAQPGSIFAVAENRGDGWMVAGIEIPAWIERSVAPPAPEQHLGQVGLW